MVTCACGCGGEIPANQLFRYREPYLLRGHQVPRLCECGCGEYLPVTPNRHRASAYIRGHSRRLNLEVPLCACGCGEKVAVHHGRPRRFVSGHNARGRSYVPSEEAKAKIRAARAVQKNVSGIRPHGLSKTPAYRSWISMLWRCRDERDISWPRYGGRGITVCARWDPRAGGSFLNFLADMGERPEGTSLDRINGDGNYEPANCRWATKAQQSANRPADNGWNKRRQS